MAKLLAEKEAGKIVGAQLARPHSTDMIAELALAIRFGLTANDLVSAIHPHPHRFRDGKGRRLAALRVV